LAGLFGEHIHNSFARRVPIWVDGAPVDADVPAGLAGIRNGAVLSLFEPADLVTREAPPGVAELRVVCGPGAGRIHRLTLGETVVGCGGTGWSLPDLRLPSAALAVRVTPEGRVTVDPADGLRVVLGSAAIAEEATWPVEAYLFAGDTVLALAEISTVTADVSVNAAEALVDFNRPPRLLPPARERAFHLPDKPAEVKSRRMPWVMVLAPMAIALPMAF